MARRGERKNIRGRRYGRITVISLLRKKSAGGQTQARVICTCGRIKVLLTGNLGQTKSCGCLASERKSKRCKHRPPALRHGQGRPHRRSGAFVSYVSARNRCNNPRGKDYARYGGAGVKFLFPDFESFFKELGDRPRGKTLDRFPNPAGNYELGNVRWASLAEQGKNRR